MRVLSHYRSNVTTRSLLFLLVALLIFAVAVLYRAATEGLEMGTQLERSTVTNVPARTRVATIEQLQTRIERNPDDVAAYATLGLALLQQVRERNDVTLYARAGQALDAALQRDPHQVDALTGKGVLALALHDFSGALQWAGKILAVNPFRAAAYGIRTDALVELGRYPDAVNAVQQMVNLRPDVESYSRVSYLRELHGDMEGAIEAMRMAAESAVPGSEPWLWTITHLGHLYWNRGELDEAARIYGQALSLRADYPYAQAGLARVYAAQGETQRARDLLVPLTQRLPLPEFLILLGELYQASGDMPQARAQYDLVGVIQQLNSAAGMNVDLELATFAVNHGADAATALQQAQAAYAARPTIYAADTLAWAFYRAGRLDEALEYSRVALNLGTQDAFIYYHAGMIARATGDDATAADYLRKAAAINPHFSLLETDALEEALATLAEP
ncbi:MAG: tetratricopeptide repeat protein [Caldilineaceae bacterium]|nr:tetratricopeptide repeat protein [Caldilineaceae bacterium]